MLKNILAPNILAWATEEKCLFLARCYLGRQEELMALILIVCMAMF